MNERYHPSEKAVKIVEKIKDMTAKSAIFIKRKPDTVIPSLTDSKFGGVPYWDMQKEYPTDSEGKRMMMLAQINFSQLQEVDTDLPNQGMLQVFITTEDDAFGIDFDNPTSQENFRMVYHDEINPNITQEQVRALGIITAEECEDYDTPIFKQAALAFETGTDYMSSDVADFPSVFAQAVKAVTGEDIDPDIWYQYFEGDDDDYLEDELQGFEHKMLGYPAFIQYDPRESMEAGEYFDTLLLQIDSDMGNDGEDYVLWGDCGIANWFINKEALNKKDFSKVLYNWDCS
ncbi:MAG: DUF1963 domain-containing protein [Lachnospiraceae bacterium]|nr:DUF1963 domain-containing protein [Lachnospiraceae bacterium]